VQFYTMINIAAVVVTNNRMILLQEAVKALRLQSYPLNHIIIINNASTDGTGEWLDKQYGLLVKHQENLGGSGGFYTGIKMAVESQADWIWVMDDDTICQPDTLQKLIDKLKLINEPVGFIGSKCIWKDGTPHLMNIPAIKPAFNKIIPFNKYDDKGLLLVETNSFVSLLLNARVVKKVGLPYKDFFIWGDDQEYSRRVTKTGSLGLYCSESIALHKTGINYFPDFYRDTLPNLWKHKYGFRNEFFMVKKNKGFLFFIPWLVVKVLYTSFKIIKIRSDNRLKFISVLAGSAWRSVFFNPKIDKV
jgi:rhamnopyranosyl-N-acetylglucosaminyl-diphospho-decaprenol beta-1,3/1,4-galactofuranosyltransferase